MSLNLKNALALLKPQEQAELFEHLAERLHQPSRAALAEYYQALLKQNPSAEEAAAPIGAKPYRTAVERASSASDRVPRILRPTARNQ